MDNFNQNKIIIPDTKSYFLIISEIKKGNKTSTSIARALNMTQGGIYDRLAILEKLHILKRDNKNWEIATKKITCGCCGQEVMGE